VARPALPEYDFSSWSLAPWLQSGRDLAETVSSHGPTLAEAPRLSVVLPNYNHGRLVPRALEALLAQDPPPDEILVVDDGSTDDSLTVLADLAWRHPSLRVIAHGENRGAIPALATGLAAARGRYVYFAAADDRVLPGFFAAALGLLERYPAAGLFCGEAALVDGETGEPLALRPPVRPLYRASAVGAAGTRDLLRRIDNWILTGSAVFRRDAVVAAGGFDPRLGSFADGYLARKVALAHGFCFAPQTVATWYVYPGSYSRGTARDLARAREALDNVPARIAADAAFPPWYAGVFAARWRFAAARLALMADPIDRTLVLALGAASGFDRKVLRLTTALPPKLARLTSLAWLWFRWRPTTLIGLARTSLTRRMERFAAPDENLRHVSPSDAARLNGRTHP
jgi:glycosyltransferase involved in cell wall biosynthesis